MESWVEASSCSCERVFSYVTTTDFGQSTERMCETLWVRCNGEAPEDWGPLEVFDMLQKTLFVHESRRRGMSLRWRMVLSCDLQLSKSCKFCWKKV